MLEPHYSNFLIITGDNNRQDGTLLDIWVNSHPFRDKKAYTSCLRVLDKILERLLDDFGSIDKILELDLEDEIEELNVEISVGI